MKPKNPLKPGLKLALSIAKSQYAFYQEVARTAQTSEVRTLVADLAEIEEDLIEKLNHMVVTGIVDELEELTQLECRREIPDPTPFDPSRNDTDPRIFVCNRVLETSVQRYMLYLRFAARTESRLLRGLFEYLAYLKRRQIEKIRDICQKY